MLGDVCKWEVVCVEMCLLTWESYEWAFYLGLRGQHEFVRSVQYPTSSCW
jgi:hypothetical protein